MSTINTVHSACNNPFVSYQDMASNPARMANLVDFSQFASDLSSKNVPDYVWISPDQYTICTGVLDP